MIKVHCLTTGWVQIKIHHQLARFNKRPARVLDVLTDRQWSPHLPIGCWLIEHPEGLFMVDTGESSRANDQGYQPWWHPFMRFCERREVKPEEEVGALLKAQDFDPLKVNTVIMTHMHGDHAGGIPNFPNSRFLLSDTEKHAIAQKDAVMNGYLTMHYPDWFQPDSTSFQDGAYAGFAQSHKVTADGKIRLVPTPGHTLGHLSVIVEMDDYCVFIGGDASYQESYLLAGKIDGVCIDENLHQQSTAKIRALCQSRPTIVQLAHDAQSAERLHQRVFTKVG